MNNSVSNIDDYINNVEQKYRHKLQELRQLILEAVPKDTIETISYGMPTFRWHGNLIHFALTKTHIGLYPGPPVILAMKEELKKYQTSKGAIQLPLDEPLPHNLIRDIVLFNIDILKEKSVPKWDTYRSNWTACDAFMRKLMSKTDLSKEFKWGTDIYTHNGKNVIAWAGFKNFFALWFYQGVFLDDKYKVLISGSEGKTKILRKWHFSHIEDMDETKIMEYINESVQAIDAGKELKVEKKSVDIEIDGFLKDALQTDKMLHEFFSNLTAGRQREYLAYINEAKQDKTKSARIEKIKPLIMNGKGLNDRYNK